MTVRFGHFAVCIFAVCIFAVTIFAVCIFAVTIFAVCIFHLLRLNTILVEKKSLLVQCKLTVSTEKCFLLKFKSKQANVKDYFALSNSFTFKHDVRPIFPSICF